ncbi:MAG TPA: hypothetical protein PKN62_02110, partial [bacterium]|nr:hypothetical protein [bacterium]
MKKTGLLIFTGLIIGCLFFNITSVQAAETETGIIQYPVISVPPTGLPVYDVGVNTQNTMKEFSTFAWSSVTSAIKKAATKTYSSLLRRYLNQIAQETAVYVANGGKGQKPSFYQWTWKSFSKDLANKAAGAYLENFFQAVQEGDQQSSTRKASVVCGSDTIKIFYYLATNSSANTTTDSISFIKNNENPVKSVENLNVDSACFAKISAALSDLDNGGGETLSSWNNGLNVDKYLGKDFDICQPSSVMVAFRIGLGIDEANVSDTEELCTATQMFGKDGGWDKAIQESVNDQKTYLRNVQNYFDPRANDLGIAMSLNSKKGTYVQKEVKAGEDQRTEDNGAIRNTNAGGKIIELPGNFGINLANVKTLQSNALMSQTGDAFIDAANIFVSVLSNKLYDKAMQRLMKLLADQDDSSTNSADNTKLTDFYSSGNLGQAESEALLAPITDMNFTAGHDIDLLNNLASCPDPNKPGVMNCVVNNNFVQAVSQGLTVGQALKKNLINGNAKFGSNNLSTTNIEVGDINWRSMKILRKYRILPVSWEVAAEMIITKGLDEGSVSIADMVGCYSETDVYDTGFNNEWCRGLIDPNWPLSSPKSYCAKSGFGNQVDYMDVLTEDQAATYSSPAVLSTVNLLRTSNYCADEQSCIKSGPNDSCQLYGYCTEDRRVWNFPSDTCEANYNTCQTYTNSAGQKTAYLANTLDFGTCNSDNTGCTAYCKKYDYTNSLFTCAPNTSTDKYYLSAKAEGCSASDAGCQQLIRLKNNNGVNLLFNGDFEFSTAGAISHTGKLDNWNFDYYAYGPANITASIVTSSEEVYAGNNSLKIETSGGGGIVSYDWTNPDKSSLPKNFIMNKGVSYTLSAYVYNTNNDSPVTIGIGNGLSEAMWVKSVSTQTSTWEKVSVTINNDQYYNANSFVIYKEGSGTFYVDNVMFEVASQGNQGYKKYREVDYTYEKIAPKSLEDLCYEEVGENRNLKNNAPAECANYARTCLPQEANCKLFTNQITGDDIPAKTNLQNYCPSNCAGFASFWQEPTSFNDGQEKQLIPKNATSCSSENVGCSEFTNLSNSNNAESREYYSYLRQCVKPDEAQANCSEFYSWQNDENTGLQLISYTWQAASNGSPKTNGTNSCTAQSLDINSAQYDPDCREVRNQAGTIFYIPYSKTITCSANCQTYRLSENNVLPNITNSNACSFANGNWLASRGECVTCKDGGTWDSNHGRCIYKGLPEESSSCSASQNGCRMYSGTGSANWRLVANFSFNNNSAENWTNSTFNRNTFRKEGGSIKVNGSTQISLDNLGIQKGKKYRLQFFAKASSSSSLINEISIYNTENSSVVKSLSSRIDFSSNWNFYNVAATSSIETDLPESGLVLKFDASGSYFLDEIRLIEVSDQYYLLKNTLNIPSECNQDYNGTPSPGFMLGCQAYSDSDKNTHYLHGFTDICQESAVGCEMMINTNNYTSHYYPFTPSGSTDQISTTTADEVLYAVYDPEKLCSSSNKGCQLLGKETSYTSQSVYEDFYIKFDPDRYRNDAVSPTICSASEVGCQTWVGDTSGLNYFRNPGDQLCEWRTKPDGIGFAWYKRPVKQCSETNITKYCLTNKECASISTTSQCIVKQSDELCPVNTAVSKTIGTGGDIIKQPKVDSANNNWVGLCPTTQSGCTEYIDPLSRSGENLVKNFHANLQTTVELEP